MAKEIFMPKLSSTMEVGTLLQWFKEEGDTVEVGEPLFEIMTDKINIEVESYEEGILLKRYYEEDSEIPINAVVGYIGEENETVPDEPPALDGTDTIEEDKEEKGESLQDAEEIETAVDESGKVRATPAARRVAREQDITLSEVSGSGPKGRIHEQDVLDYAEKTSYRMTPLAEKMMKDEGFDPSEITGTGARGKIEKDDVLRYKNALTQEEEQVERIKLTGLRKIIADKMLESKRNIPHVNLTTEINMEKVMDLRKSILPIIEEQTGYRLSFTEIIMKTTAHTLAKHTRVNASLINDEIILNKVVNIGLAVAIDNGLIVPSIHRVNEKGLAQLTTESKELGQKARENKLLPDDMKGSTFTISNLGMYAIDGFTPIINPPETAILGVGRITKKPIVVDDSIVIKPMMVLSLSFDHRAMDGAPAAAFLTDLKNNLENPYSLFV